MTQFYSRNDVNYSGDVYSIPFDYIDKKEVKVYIDDELWTKWHFLNKHQLTLDEVPEDIRYSNIISVRRETDIEEKVVTYDNNSLLTKENLNKSQDQLLFAVQEIYDNNIQNNIDIRAEVDEKVERVSDAVEKLEFLEDSVEIANEAALEATEQAQIATEKAEETLNTYNEAMAEIDTLRQDSIDEVNQLVADHTDDLNALDQLIKKDADAIINRVGLNMFDTVIKDHILTYEESKGLAPQGTYVYKEALVGSRYGYHDFYNKGIEEYNQATATETVNGVTVKVHSNGHKFYNISDKTAIDELFNTIGSAWFYGVDTENERIFLPRDKYFAVNGVAPVAGNGKALGMTDGTSDFGMIHYTTSAVGATLSSKGYTGQNAGATTSDGVGTSGVSGKFIGVTTDPTKSGIEARLTANEDKYLYICVGNTEVKSAVANVVDVTTTENDTLPLFTGQYFDFTPNHLSWLKGGRKARESEYPTCYNELVDELVSHKYGLKVINEADMITGIDYSEYWKVNQDDMTFTTPTAISLKALDNIAPVVGNGMTLGLTDGTNESGLSTAPYSNAYGFAMNRGAIGSLVGSDAPSSGISVSNKYIGVTSDPSKSGIEAHLVENSNAQLYFKVANAVQNLELLDVGKVMGAVADKVDVSNTEWATNACMPDYSAGVNIVSGFVAPNNGLIIFTLSCYTVNTSAKGYINNILVAERTSTAGTYGTVTKITVPVFCAKGDEITFTSTGGEASAMFYPLKGAN